ncbi:uncharacterized protein A1O9_12081 [Exophiala aquamarina CBS 119918]|uniref:F-box domain-containing protein n=1 Tax=Exophiala aquamarina CBS 119918 TaxID=1182545 RepID=A0A072NV41_9EURO|nr:uncharacterized protein A1O9_12081 [Exophiala aquamarina CBS 119918]KEF51744.1 hypothetical protein A1O9_12081 [Exophiala aquamarina CBS 119918]
MAQPQQASPELTTLTTLPPEVLLNIFAYLEVPDLLQTSRTCHQLRTLACDPLLHLTRLHSASQTLSYLLARRASKSSISPPSSWICLSKTNVLSRQISKSLIRIRLSHNLEHRPSPAELVERAILLPVCGSSYSSPVSPALIQSHQAVQRRSLRDRLARKLQRRPSVASLVDLNIIPAECVRATTNSSRSTTSYSTAAKCTNCCTTSSSPSSPCTTLHSGSQPHHPHPQSTSVIVSPAIVLTRRNVIRETLKDGLRAWVEGRGLQAQKRKADELDAAERANVKTLVRRFAARKLAADAELDWVRERRRRRAAAAASGSGVGTSVSQKQCALPPESRQRCWGREAEMAKAKDRERRERLRHDHDHNHDHPGAGGNDGGRADAGGGGGGGGIGEGVDHPYCCSVCPQPTRAHVLGLKRFWEGVIRAAAAG